MKVVNWGFCKLIVWNENNNIETLEYCERQL
jgi:hypothetical protein